MRIKKSPTAKPIAVLISDIHFNLSTLEVATQALQQAIEYSNKNSLKLIIAGDLHDTKANIRGECVNRIISLLETLIIRPIILRGNHCSLNEKSKEHSLGFLKEYGMVVNHAMYLSGPTLYYIPYYHDLSELRSYLRQINKNSILIMHQGILGSDSGEYMQDPTALHPDDVKDFRVISGHYHRRQDILTGMKGQPNNAGTWSFIGNPFTLNFGEADHPEKGFQILHDDGSLEFIPTNLRKHEIYDVPAAVVQQVQLKLDNTILWLKVRGTPQELANISKQTIKVAPGAKYDYRLELIPTETTFEPTKKEEAQDKMIDNIIDSLENTDVDKEELKLIWRTLCIT